MPAHDLALLTEAARAAGEVALRYWKNAPKAWDKADASPVTEADLACNDLIQGILRRARPSYGWPPRKPRMTPPGLIPNISS